MEQALANPTLQPVIAALAAGLVTLIGAAVTLAVKLMNAKAKQLEIAATAGVRIAEAQAAPQTIAFGASAEKKVAATVEASKLLAQPLPEGKLGAAVQAAWQKDDDTRRASLPPGSPDA